jgi:hypothetical protein
MSAEAKTLLTILSALALLAGCKPSPPKTGYLSVKDGEVSYLEWTQEGTQVKGSILIQWRSPAGEIENYVILFHGEQNRESIILTFDTSWSARGGLKEMGVTIPGALRGANLTLIPTNGSEATEYHLASPQDISTPVNT